MLRGEDSANILFVGEVGVVLNQSSPLFVVFPIQPEELAYQPIVLILKS
jgi:hypothetical protein